MTKSLDHTVKHFADCCTAMQTKVKWSGDLETPFSVQLYHCCTVLTSGKRTVADCHFNCHFLFALWSTVGQYNMILFKNFVIYFQ